MKQLSAMLVGLSLTASAHAADPPALKDVFADDFRVGAAVGTRHVMAGAESPELKLVALHYNTITPENLLKWAEIHPDPDRYNWEPADRYVAFSRRCTHEGCGVHYTRRSATLDCTCHGGRYSAEDGRVLAGPPPRPLARVRVVRQGADLIAVGVETVAVEPRPSRGEA